MALSVFLGLVVGFFSDLGHKAPLTEKLIRLDSDDAFACLACVVP